MKLNKSLCLGLVLGICITSSIPLIAKTTQYVLSKVNYTLNINNENYTPKGDILSYKGTIYVPVKDIAEALNMNLAVKNNVIDLDNGSENSLLENSNVAKSTKKARTAEETEQIIKDLGVPDDSDLARDLREDPYLQVNTQKYKNKNKDTNKAKEESIVNLGEEINGCVCVSNFSDETRKVYSNIDVNSKINDVSWSKNKGDNDYYKIKGEKIPVDSIGDVPIYGVFNNPNTPAKYTKGGIIDGKVYLDKSFIESLKRN